MMDERLQRAKTIITEETERAGYCVRKILLFGSRARGDARPDSDWDILVLVDKEMNRSKQMELSANIRRRLVFQSIVADVLIVSQDAVRERRNDVGHILYYALKEGVAL